MTDDQVVRTIQAWLRDHGYPVGTVDGDWGPLSQHAWGLARWNLSRHTAGLPTPPAAPSRAAGGLRRIIWHWTAGSYAAASALLHYHFVIDGTGQVHAGTLRPEDNISTSDGRYTPHVLNANTGAIGIAIAAMTGAREAPFAWGRYPMLEGQVDALVRETGRLCALYGIPVDRRTTLSHAEVQPTLGITQRGKWDIAVLPGMTKPGNPIAIGDMLRERTSAALLAA